MTMILAIFHKIRGCSALSFFLLCLLWAIPSFANSPMRIICVSSGPLEEFRSTLFGFARELIHAGVISADTLPSALNEADQSRQLWLWLAEHTKGSVLFLEDGFYSADWDDGKRPEIRQTVLQRLTTRQDVDAILVLGTRAGQDISTLPTDVPVIVASSTNAVEAGITKSVVDSGKNNLLALVNPWRFLGQIKFFHTLFPFRKLGVVYEDTPTGRNVVALKEIEQASATLHVELVRCHTPLHGDAEEVTKRVVACHYNLLSQGVDAVYLTYNVAMTPEQTRRTLAPLLAKGIPTFSQSGVDNVKCGALASFVDDSFIEGRYAAQRLLSIMDGILPRALSQKFQSPILIAINLGTAALMGWNPPLEILLTVDEFYD